VSPTVREIAAETGVSIATVSRVLNGHANVAAHTRDLVHRAIERRGGYPAGPSETKDPQGVPVFVRCPYLLDDYFGAIVSSIAETLELHGRQLSLNAGNAAQGTSALAGLANRPDVAGAILILPPESGADLVSLQDNGLPLVVVDPRIAPPPGMASVSAAHAAGARQLTRHLTTLGHRRIGVLGGPDEWLASDSRRAGHAAALTDVGVFPATELFRADQPTVEHGYRAALSLLDMADPPTAIVGFNDRMAVGTLQAAADRGLRVPQDLSIAGFDDIEVSRVTQPALTTVHQPLEEMGRMAVNQILRLVDGHAIHALHVELAVQLVVRGSTGPAGH
jgi:LacI family transcriptional regulator